MTQKQKSQLKALWFARWISMCYADTFVEHGNRKADGSLAPLSPNKGGISVLNAENGKWYADQMSHFESKIYPQWLKMSKEKNDLDPTLEIISKSQEEYKEEQRKRKEDPDYLMKKIEEKEKLLEAEQNDLG
jgi:hypothetical protein